VTKVTFAPFPSRLLSGLAPNAIIEGYFAQQFYKLGQQNEQQTSDWADFGPPDFCFGSPTSNEKQSSRR